ncbi:MAG: NAD-dependent epimerase/dehydratase family protein [Pseudomonadota bacterium]
MKILVLGGNGFLGSHIVDELLVNGHEVSIFDRSASKNMPFNPNIHYYLGDFSDSVLISEALESVECVVHCISTTVPSTSNRNPTLDIEQNLITTVNLLESMTRAKVYKLIYLSSGGTVYGIPKHLPVTEQHSLNPICSYGVVKVAIENYIGMFKELYGLKPIILRPSNPYGVRQGHAGVQGALSTFLFNTIAKKPISIWGDGEIQRGYIYAKDLAVLCRLAVESDAEGTYNVCSGKSHSLNQLLTFIESATGITPNVTYQPARAFDVKNIVLDISEAKKVFGWEPQYSIEQGISEFYQSLK